MKKDIGMSERFRRGVRRSSNGSERSSGSAGNKYIVIYINYELILIIKGIYLKAIRGSNFLMGQISDLGPMRESAFWKDAFEAPRVLVGWPSRPPSPS